MVKSSLTRLINSALITDENHSSDNSFITNEFCYFEANLLHKRYEPCGVCFNLPYNPYDSNMVAYVFKENEEVRWVHMPERCLLHLLSDLYGRSEAKSMIANKLREL